MKEKDTGNNQRRPPEKMIRERLSEGISANERPRRERISANEYQRNEESIKLFGSRKTHKQQLEKANERQKIQSLFTSSLFLFFVWLSLRSFFLSFSSAFCLSLRSFFSFTYQTQSPRISGRTGCERTVTWLLSDALKNSSTNVTPTIYETWFAPIASEQKAEYIWSKVKFTSGLRLQNWEAGDAAEEEKRKEEEMSSKCEKRGLAVEINQPPSFFLSLSLSLFLFCKVLERRLRWWTSKHIFPVFYCSLLFHVRSPSCTK